MVTQSTFVYKKHQSLFDKISTYILNEKKYVHALFDLFRMLEIKNGIMQMAMDKQLVIGGENDIPCFLL